MEQADPKAPAALDGVLAERMTEASLTQILSTLVSVPSVNPDHHEEAIARRVAGWFQDVPEATVEIVEFAPGRPSVAVVIAGAEDGPRLILNGHMDTVPIDDAERWTAEPFGAEVRDGCLFGRGACDMKAGLAVQIAVGRELASMRDSIKGSLVLHFAAGEERGEPGTLSLLQAGFGGDLGITTEPTQLKVATATRGIVAFKITLKGRSIHASRAPLGVNPIGDLAELLAAVDAYQREVEERTHPLLGSGLTTPTMLDAGVAQNAVPDVCTLVLDRRLIPGETVEGERARLERHIEAARGRSRDFDYELEILPIPFEPAEIAADSPFALHVAQRVRDVVDRPGELFGAPFASDVRNLINDGGVEAITFGPGNVAHAHATDERVAIDELRDAAKVTAQVVEDVLVDGTFGV